MLKMTKMTIISSLPEGKSPAEPKAQGPANDPLNAQREPEPLSASELKQSQRPTCCEGLAPEEIVKEKAIAAVTQYSSRDTSLTLRRFNSLSDDSNSHSPPTHSLLWQLRWWSLEIVSIVFAILCLISIVVILRAFDGKPQNSWPSDVLTLNGLVALLATTCRMSFIIAVGAGLAQGKWQYLQTRARGNDEYQLVLFHLFGEAAKGPWGSTRLMWRLKGSHISCLGAAVTILSLAFSLFTQQLIDIRAITVPSEFIPGAFPGAVGQVPRLSHLKDEYYNKTGKPPPFIKMAIYNGLTRSSIEPPQVNCPTGNCTWPVIPTLGVCGACVDVTETIEFRKDSAQDCVSKTGKVQIDGPCSPKGRSDKDEWPTFVSGAGSGEVFSAGQGPSDEFGGNVITTFTGIGFAKGQVPLDNLTNFLSRAQAHECALWYCVQAHQIVVDRGELHDEVVDTWHQAQKIKGGFIFDDIPPEYNVEPDDLYEGRSSLLNNIKEWFNLTTEGTLHEYEHWFRVKNTSNYTEGDLIDPFWSNFDNLEPWIGRMAASLSNMLRSIDENGSEMKRNSSEAPEERYRGTVHVDRVYIHVRWVWMVYLVALLLLAVVFLAIQITHAIGGGSVRSWKDDIFALLWLQVDKELKKRLRAGLDDPAGFERVVSKYQVRVSREGNGLPTKLHLKED